VLRFADFFEAREVPKIGKGPALSRFYQLNAAVVSFEEDAFAVRLVLERESLAISSEPSKLLNEIPLGNCEESRDRANLAVCQTNLSRPTAAGRATIAFVEDRHDAKIAPEMRNPSLVNFRARPSRRLIRRTFPQTRLRRSQFRNNRRRWQLDQGKDSFTLPPSRATR
jgi:hypothetical protein